MQPKKRNVYFIFILLVESAISNFIRFAHKILNCGRICGLKEIPKKEYENDILQFFCHVNAVKNVSVFSIVFTNADSADD